MLTVSKVYEYPKPHYPVKEMVMANPAVLYTLPERWKRNTAVCAAIAATTAMLLTAFKAAAMAKSNAMIDAQPSAFVVPPPFVPQTGPASVAPIFEHGRGRGSFGCDAVAPPIFLSEEEAYQVIREVAEAEGMQFNDRMFVVKNARVPMTKLIFDDYHSESSMRG